MHAVKNINSLRRAVLLPIIAAIGLFCLTAPAHAIINNRVNIPYNPVLNDMITNGQNVMTDTYQNSDGKGKTCQIGQSFVHGVFTWLSLRGDNSAVDISMPLGTDKLQLQLNDANFACDALINKSGGFTNTDLQATKVRLPSGSGSSKVQISGTNIPAGVNLSIDASDFQSRPIQTSWQTLYANNWRFYKEGNNGVPSRNIDINGLKTLGPGTYNLKVTLYDVAVNRFGSNNYLCVYNPGVPTNDLDSSDGKCVAKPDGTYFNFQLTVEPTWAGTCSVDIPDRIEVGSSFKARFNVTNTGTKDWSTFFMQLGSGHYPAGVAWTNDYKYDNTVWGPNRVKMKTPFDYGGFPVVPSGKSTGWWDTDETFTAPTTPGTRTFAWRILQSGSSDQSSYPDKTNIGKCSKQVEVYQKANKPVISVQGADVISGASFQMPVSGEVITTPKALAADIATNGYYDNTFFRQLQGSSGAQYGVFASGSIGDITDISAGNAFTGNFGYYRDSLDAYLGGYSGNARDALFAVVGSGGSSNYGHFYSDASDPNNDGILPQVTEVADLVAQNYLSSSISAGQAAIFLRNGDNGGRAINGDVTIGNISIPQGVNKVIAVDGNVTIDGNISYPGSYSSATDYPSVKIIAKNIFIKKAVKRIDADIIAFPLRSSATSLSDGILDTCSDNSGLGGGAGVWPSNMTTSSCSDPNGLEFNGSVVARRILWKRTNGTTGTASDAADPSCALSTRAAALGASNPDPRLIYDPCSAELIKYTPLNYLSGFNDGKSTLDSIPVNSQELPPIY